LYTFYVSGRNRHARLATVVQQYIGQTKAMAYLDFIDDVNEGKKESRVQPTMDQDKCHAV